MIDTRENILARLVQVVAGIPNMRTAQRNNPDIPEYNMLPAGIIYDGDEETNDASDLSMRPPNRPTLVTMHPEIVIVHKAGEAGSELHTLRRELIRSVLYDVNLNEQIVKTGRFGNGAIRYLGCMTDLHFGSSLQGGMRAHFMFKYKLDPADL